VKKLSILSGILTGIFTLVFIIAEQNHYIHASIWKILNDALFILSILICCFIGYKSESLNQALGRCLAFYVIYFIFYQAGYIVSIVRYDEGLTDIMNSLRLHLNSLLLTGILYLLAGFLGQFSHKLLSLLNEES